MNFDKTLNQPISEDYDGPPEDTPAEKLTESTSYRGDFIEHRVGWRQVWRILLRRCRR